MKKQVITVSGNIAVGKSEVSQLVASKLDFPLYKASESFRACAREHNMSLVDFNKYIEDKPEIDMAIEEKTKQHVSNLKSVVVDARLGFYVVPDSFRVYMKANIDVAAKRLFEVSKSRGAEETYYSLDEAKKGIITREKAENDRYHRIYNVNIHDEKNYDLVIDTTNTTKEEVADLIINKYYEWLRAD